MILQPRFTPPEAVADLGHAAPGSRKYAALETVEAGAPASTFCPRLWTDCFVNWDGAVYHCSHNRPGILGNINDTPLQEIFLSETAGEYRRQSQQGLLDCYRQCHFLDKRLEAAGRVDDPPAFTGLGQLKLVFGELCNIACLMCWQNHRDTRTLSFEAVRANVDLAPFREIHVQGGEPLAIKSARQFFDYATAMGKKVSFLTNGLLITEEWAEKIARGSAMVHISLNAATRQTHERVNRGSCWLHVMQGLERLQRHRDALASDLRIEGEAVRRR